MTGNDNQYVNLRLYNEYNYNRPAILTVKRQTPIVMDPENYNLVVSRFTIQTVFPLFYPTISAGSITDMSITFGYTGNFYQQFIVVTPEEAKGGVFNIGTFLSQLNVASRGAFLALSTAQPLAPGRHAPYFAFDPQTQLVSMYVDSGWQDSNPLPSTIYFNQQLQTLLNLPSISQGLPPNPNGTDYIVMVKDYAKSLPDAGSRFGYPLGIQVLTGVMTQVEQEFIQTTNFIDRDKIIFTSGSLPIVDEIIPGVGSQNASVSNAFLPVLTDFALGGTGDRSNFIEYLPTAEYRRITMRKSQPIDYIDLQLYYTTRDGNLIPLMLPPKGLVDVKLIFERKK